MKYQIQEPAYQQERNPNRRQSNNEAAYVNMGYEQRGNNGGQRRGNNNQPVFQQGNGNNYNNQIDSNNRITFNIYNPPSQPQQSYNQYNNCQVQQFNHQPPVNYPAPINYIQVPPPQIIQPPPTQVILQTPYMNACSHPPQSRKYRKKIGDKALLWMVILLIVFFPLFWLPLFMEECQDTEIHCCHCQTRIS